ncbi:MAG: ABC transporter permease, partial [Halobaculum sp.]
MATEDSDSGLDTIKRRWEPRIERFRRGWDRFTEHKVGVLGLVIMVIYAAWAIAPGVFAPHSPQWIAYLGEPPHTSRLTAKQIRSLPHPPAFGKPFFAPLGTNASGQGILSLTIHSTRTAMYIGLAAGTLSSLIGVPLGLISGFYGDTWIDETIQRIVDIMYGLPFLPFLIVLVAIRGITTTNIIIGIAVTSWLNNCITIRGETLSLKERSYVESAKVAGASDTRIMFRHILPNVLPL